MKRILDRYIFREIAVTWLGVTLILLMILLTNQFARILGDVAKGQSDDYSAPVCGAVLARLGMAHRRLHGLAEAEERLVLKVREVASGGGFLRKVPRLEGQVHDLFALYVVGKSIFSRPAEVL